MNVKPHWLRHLSAGVRHGAWALLFTSCLPSHASAFSLFGIGRSGDGDAVVLEVEEPFIEMHTGPGRGYPVFNVVEKGETIKVLKRKPGWYEIRSADEKTGWAKAAELAHTLEPTGTPVDLPEVTRSDYLTSWWRIGFAGGQLEGASTISATAGFRPLRWAEVEIEGGKIFDESVTSDYYGMNLLVEPMPDWVIAPYVSAGAGKFSLNNRQKVVVEDAGSPSYVSLGAGASYYIVSNFALRGGYRSYSITTDGDRVWLNAWTIGLNIFF
jgi:hypothetical protein